MELHDQASADLITLFSEVPLESILRRRAYTPLDTATHSAIIEPQEMKVRFHRQAEKTCNIQCMQAKRLYSSLWLCPCAGHCAECCPYVLLPDSIHRAQSRAVRAGRPFLFWAI